MEYNDSPLTKEEWDSAEALCKQSPELEKVWIVFVNLFKGQSKKAIQTYDKLIQWCEMSVDIITMFNEDDISEDDLLVGATSDSEALMRSSIQRMLKDKDDKTPERIKAIVEGYPKYLSERERIVSSLSADDEAELLGKKSRLAEIAESNRVKEE